MIKQIIALLTFSVVVILSMSYTQSAVHLLISAHEWISQLLTAVFSGGEAGNLARGLIALLSLPVLVSLVPATAYWMVRRHWFPYFMEIVWVVWLVQVGALIVSKAAA